MEEYTENDWIGELAKYFTMETRRPGDIDSRQISAEYNVCIETALRKMERIAREDPGNWEIVTVRDGGGKPPIKVLRKKC